MYLINILGGMSHYYFEDDDKLLDIRSKTTELEYAFIMEKVNGRVYIFSIDREPTDIDGIPCVHITLSIFKEQKPILNYRWPMALLKLKYPYDLIDIIWYMLMDDDYYPKCKALTLIGHDKKSFLRKHPILINVIK
jgi:hypothetical protein